MYTLREELKKHGYIYKSLFTDRADDVYFSSLVELCEAIGYITRNVRHIDGEYPKGWGGGNMEIADGYTSGGHKMKLGRQWRIYLNGVQKTPALIAARLHNDNYMRFGGSRFVEALLYCGFSFGYNQNATQIRNNIFRIYSDQACRNAFDNGYNIIE